ncbi:hypothetical protein ALC60_09204 [Trachymyrmex zeteki]|uniref:BED-type domain-containing protein n=1 Tax=Mycetomoellerius zeteki TaxID=64791 RepID=A0A151WV54_9HYME|nr:hypothetical protein ALC60_09204 [Trachymyrmex zeteki]
MDANKDITLRKTKRQEASSNSTNLSDNLYECAEGTEAINEATTYNLIPIRRWMREHYTRLTGNARATCNHCDVKFNIDINYLLPFHKHLVKTHPDKLIEEEKNEVQFHWVWDYYIVKNERQATCKRCTSIIICDTAALKKHLKRMHKISVPSDNVTDNEINSDDERDANKDITLRKAKRQEASSNLTNLSDSLNEYTEGIKGLNEEAQNNLVPVRLWIRGHYTELTRTNETKCIHCNVIFPIYMNKLDTLHKHLVETHSDKLAEEQKKEIKFHWIWDYYIEKNDRHATCKRCKRIIMYNSTSDLGRHLKETHKISGPTSDNVIDNEESSLDDDMDITLRKAKHQEASSNSTNLSDNLYEYAEGTEAIINEEAADNFIPVRCWIREHYTKLTRSNEATCNHCNAKFVIHISNLIILHKHLVEAHPDKLAKEQKNEIKFHWIWDHYIAKSDREASCNRCKTIVICDITALKKHLRRIHNWPWDYFTLKDCMSICKICKAAIRSRDVTQFKGHLKKYHKIFGPGSDNDIDNENNSDNYMDADTTVKNAKHQEDLSNSTGSYNNSYEETRGTEYLNENL